MEDMNSKIDYIQEALKTKFKTIEIKSQLYHQEILQYAIQGVKPQCFKYFDIIKTANSNEFDKQNLIIFGVRRVCLIGW